VSAAQEAAQKTIAEVEVIRLSREAQEKFAALLLSPPPPSPALVKALKRRPANGPSARAFTSGLTYWLQAINRSNSAMTVRAAFV
jgi:uncharacterized protein DUF1778